MKFAGKWERRKIWNEIDFEADWNIRFVIFCPCSKLETEGQKTSSNAPPVGLTAFFHLSVH